MERVIISVVFFLLFCTGQVHAQFSGGNVVVHSDPRLAVLLKRNPTALPPPTPVSYHEETVKRKRNSPATEVKGPKKPGLPNAPTHDFPISQPATTAGTNNNKKADATTDRPYSTPLLHQDGRIIYSGRGYRVQIYSGSDRDKAIKVKKDFMRLNPGVRTYLTYLAPFFRVKVGDYRNRSDAEGMLREANSTYESPCMIVPDDVIIRAN